MSGRFAFVIPVVNPGNSKVRSYGKIESALRETLHSLLAQSHVDTGVVVVCHRIPAWAASVGDRVRFVDVGNHRAFAPNRNDVRVDKGMKYALGCLLAIGRDNARFVMLADADDFVRTDLAQAVFDIHPQFPGKDGFLITRGVHVQIDWSTDRPAVTGAFEVASFNRTCGSCRVFDVRALRPALAELDPGFLDHARDAGEPDSRGVVSPPAELLDYLDRLTDPIRHDEAGVVRILGRHTRQRDRFSFAILEQPLAAKGCGHGNHDGRRRGEVHWGRITRFVKPAKFLEDFGLASGDRFDVRPDLVAMALGSAGWVYRHTIGWSSGLDFGTRKY
jgi:hypothetical protein